MACGATAALGKACADADFISALLVPFYLPNLVLPLLALLRAPRFGSTMQAPPLASTMPLPFFLYQQHLLITVTSAGLRHLGLFIEHPSQFACTKLLQWLDNILPLSSTCSDVRTTMSIHLTFILIYLWGIFTSSCYSFISHFSMCLPITFLIAKSRFRLRVDLLCWGDGVL